MNNMTNETLVTQIKAGINTADNMLALWQQNNGIIRKIANRYKGRAEIDDLIQEGYIGLCRAVDHYEPREGVSFISYAFHWIQQGMQRYVENNGTIQIPAYKQAAIQKYLRTVSKFQQKHGYKPNIKELERLLFIPCSEIEQLQKDALCSKISSTDVTVDDDGQITMLELLPGCDGIEEEIIERINNDELKKILWNMVDNLPEQQCVVIHERYEKNLTRQAISDNTGYTVEKIHQAELKGLRTLRNPIKSKKLRPFITSDIYKAYSDCGVQAFNRTWTSSTERVALKHI